MRAERTTPRAHLVVDDFFAPDALEVVLREVDALDRHTGQGLVRDVGHDGQSVFFEHPRRKNRAVWIHDPSKTLRLFREHLWSPSLLEWLDGAREPLFQIVRNCWSPNLQVSRYLTGDHYDFHEDEGAGVNLTAIVFLARHPEKIRGGDLTLAYEGQEATVRFRHNRLVVFPSKTLHRVTRVRVASGDPRDARVSLQSWLAYGRAPETGQAATRKTTKNKSAAPRPVEADRPTFLLTEVPIVAAAQRLLATPDAAEHGPEELYWGAFYVSRILAQNLRWLAEASGLAPGAVRLRRVPNDEGGDDLEVACPGRAPGGERVRVGFRLRGVTVDPSEAVSLFVETGRGAARRRRDGLAPAGDEGPRSLTLVRRLLRAALEA